MARIIDFITVEEAEIPLIENFVRWAYESDCDAVDFFFPVNFMKKFKRKWFLMLLIQILLTFLYF